MNLVFAAPLPLLRLSIKYTIHLHTYVMSCRFPQEIAQVIEVMEDELVVDVLRVVNPRKSGEILGALEPKIAARVSELMTNTRRR